MADLLTHVLVAFVLTTVASWRYAWLTPPLVTVVMVGAASPDLTRIELVLPAATVEAALGVTFSWGAFQTLGGPPSSSRSEPSSSRASTDAGVVLLLALGALSYHALDLLLVSPSSRAYAVGWPLAEYHPPTSGLNLSSDRGPALLAGLLAALTWAYDRRRESQPVNAAPERTTSG
ncbi:metal-dependent hydrolase [Natrialba sp. INN-245]|uniref:metal-dependent hydrolase n=1 Tax=Natrialba sp. INN-245 TaxID=2690967 RepID=UPI0013130499|nr:metal-dependent hydrolase [Natrialba sp. INN-245]MWV40058.1 metal-dependent hydrolase [Natrialba sp. INN-245]